MRRTSDAETLNLNSGRLPAVAGEGMPAPAGIPGTALHVCRGSSRFRRVICLASLHGVLSRVQTFLPSSVRDGGATGTII